MLFKHPVCGPALALGVLLASQAFARDAVDIAAAQVDAVPPRSYSLGTNGPSQFDCSGLTWYAFASVGIELPTQAATQAAGGAGTLIVSPNVSDLVRGDLLFFDTFDDDGVTAVTHVGVYEGNGKMLNAVSEDFGLRRSEITAAYWVPRLLSARRLPSISGVPSSKFAVGDKVEVTEDGVSVRRLRQQTLLGSRNAGDTGRVDFGPVFQSRAGTAYWWWRVNFDSGTDGWIAEDYLEKSATPRLVTYRFTGQVTELSADYDPALWAVMGVVPSVGSRFSGRFAYDANAAVARVMSGLNYFDNAVRDFRVNFLGGREAVLATSGSPLRNELQTRVSVAPPIYILNMVTTLNVPGTTARLGHSSAFHSSLPFIEPPGATLPSALPSVDQLDMSNFFFLTMLNPPLGAQAGYVVGRLDTLTKE